MQGIGDDREPSVHARAVVTCTLAEPVWRGVIPFLLCGSVAAVNGQSGNTAARGRESAQWVFAVKGHVAGAPETEITKPVFNSHQSCSDRASWS